ncbi:phytanoyl-CoA dioxygenase [Chromatiales bacterium (ex Bugula neritina AB1)]|nr:phytanoyl-CoA dioxygenase [Chromatiales bacterium (ex Bugula neritina AB1)]
MPKILTAQQIEQFHEEGFISPIDVMSEDEATGYLHRFELAETEYPDHLNARNRNNPHLGFTCFDELAHHPVILDAVEDLLGSSFSLWGSVLFAKEPQTQHFVSWHQDATYMGLQPQNFLTPWIALTPSNLKNGCMTMLPGTHRNGVLKHDETFAEDNILTRGQNIPDLNLDSAIDLILRPGQMSIHHALTIHSSQPNRSSKRRIGYALQSFVSSGCAQTIGENLWLPARGTCEHPNKTELARPQSNMDPKAVEQRRLANDNWADILYRGADKVRAY